MKQLLLLLAIVAPACLGSGWQQLPNTKIAPVCPGLPNCAGVVNAWSGGVADTQRNWLRIWGGGHGDYGGNEEYALDLSLATPTMTRLNNPSPVNPNYANCPATLADGNPNARHSAEISYNPTRDTMLVFSGSVACANGSHFGDLWEQSMSTLQWTRKDPVNGAAGKQPKDFYTPAVETSAYDPNTGLTFLSTTTALWSYNATTNTYALLNQYLGAPVASSSVIDPVRKLLIFIGSTSHFTQYGLAGVGGAAIMAVSIAPGSNYALQDWTNQAVGCGTLAGSSFPGVAYHDPSGTIIGWPNFGGTVYQFDAGTKTCTPLVFAGGPPDSRDYNGNPYSTGTYRRFAYFPSLDLFAVVNSINNDAYTLRLGPTPPPPPPVITSALAATGIVGSAFSYTIAATNAPTSYAAANLPLGLSVNSATGAVNGTPALDGVYNVLISATNAGGVGSATLTLTISPQPPVPYDLDGDRLVTPADVQIAITQMQGVCSSADVNSDGACTILDVIAVAKATP